jgi:hypothetical protein
VFARLKYPGGVCPNKQTGVSIPRQSEKWRAKVYETWLIGNLGRAGVSELGQIAGARMLVAYITSITVLPALLYVLHPPGEQDTLGIAALAANSQWLNCAAGNTVAAPAIWLRRELLIAFCQTQYFAGQSQLRFFRNRGRLRQRLISR